MIKFFQKSETDKYIIIKILFIKITFKKKPRKNKPQKSDIDTIVWWIPIKSLRDSIRNIYYEYKNNLNQSNSRIDNLYPFIENGYLDIYKRFDNSHTFLVERFNYIYKNVYNLKYPQKSWERGWIDKFYSDMENMDIQNLYYKLIENLDNESVNEVFKIIARIQYSVNHINENYIDIYTKEEMLKINDIRKNFINNKLKLGDVYKYEKYLLPIDHFEVSVFYYKHEIMNINKDYIKDKSIIDVGGFIGDSALILSDYTNHNVYTFEPSKHNFENMLKTIKINNKKNIIAINKGLGKKSSKEKLYFYGSASTANENNVVNSVSSEYSEEIEIITLDNFVADNNLLVGLIKVDIEGLEQDFLKGAENTIKTQKPTLIISIYHSASDFFKIKPLIENWNLGYNFKIVKPLDGQILLETILIAELK